MEETRIHPVTGETLRRGVRIETVRRGGRAEDVAVAGWYPDGDGDSIHTGADLAAEQEAWVRLKGDEAGDD